MPRAHNFIDLTGRRFGRLIAQEVVTTGIQTRWRCLCDCGKISDKRYQHLVNGLSRSCGCLRVETSRERMSGPRTHGAAGHPLYHIWIGMIDRCTNPTATRFHRYGGRGIAVCKRWLDPHNFFADMGNRPTRATLERINNDLGYSPENCRWATYKEQNNNRCTTRLIEYQGLKLSGAEWARRLGIEKTTLYSRLKYWPLERALTPGHSKLRTPRK